MLENSIETNLNGGIACQPYSIDTIRVLIADIHQIVRQGVRQEIEKHHDIFVVGETDDGQELLQLTEQLGPHVIVLDINLRNLSGIEVARYLGKRRAGNPDAEHAEILVFSSYHDRHYVWSMLSAGAKGYLLKQDYLGTVVDGIRSVASGQTVLNQQIQNTMLRFIPEMNQELSGSEISIVQLLARGLSNDEIARQLNISEGTVKSHLQNTYRKIPWIRNRAEAVTWAWINRVIVE